MIARARKRPRKRSMSFRTLGWLIRQEAYYRIRFSVRGDVFATERRLAFLRERSVTRRARVEAVLIYNSARRYYP